jgi:hypothetical protein
MRSISVDLTYYIRNFVESQPEDEKWIDILFILLKAKPIEEQLMHQKVAQRSRKLQHIQPCRSCLGYGMFLAT